MSGRARALAALVLVALAAASVLAAPVVAGPPPAPPTASELSAHVRALAAPAMEGRGSSTPGGERAARYIEDALAALGLRPGGDGGGFRQPFAIDSVPRVGGGAVLERLGPGGMRFAAGAQWQPHGGAPARDVSGEVVRVGHGVVDGAQDDYAGVDARGKVALAMDGVPPGTPGGRATRLDKLIAARRHGATALLIATDALPAPDATATPFDLPSASVGRDVAAALPAGAAVRLHVDLTREERRADNVIAVLPGSDPMLADEALVIGAHYDHLGRDGGRVYAGADDNASGTSIVLGLARALAGSGGLPRTVVFALFSGEELGLLGSRHYAAHPTVPIGRTAAMLNFDMVGRLGSGRLRLGGVASGSGLRATVDGASQPVAAGLDVDVDNNPHGPSDHASFYAAGVPVLFFHTGPHGDYHEPSDTADKIDADGMARISALALRLVERLAAAPRPGYVQLAPPAPRGRPGAPAAAGRAFLGVTADGRRSDGVRLGGVLPGTAAERAGLRGGDVLVRISESAVDSFADLRRAIGERRPGDLVRLVYLRDGLDHTAEATLGSPP